MTSTTAQIFFTGDGTWGNQKYVALDLTPDVVVYRLYWNGSPDEARFDISYTKSTGVWSQLPGSQTPYKLNTVNSSSGSTDTVLDSEYIYGFHSNNALYFKFASPWYEPSTPPNTNSYLDASVSYLVDDNELRVYIPLDKPSTVGTDMYYQLRKISGTSFWTRIVHTQGTATNETIVPTTAGIYQLEKVQSSPYISTTYDTAEVSQAQLDFYAANNPPDDDPPDDDPPDDDPPENDPPPTPVFVPRSARRGNLNFW